jgi:hypothetical protein
MYDIIGDIHGHYDLLVTMLNELGYKKNGKSYSHPNRKVIFTGDYINRPRFYDTVRLIWGMDVNNDALAIIGNLIFNALSFIQHN